MPHGVCPSHSPNDACNLDVTETIKSKCLDKEECFIDISNSVFGSDPCEGTTKNAKVSYKCVKVEPKHEKKCTEALENEEL